LGLVPLKTVTAEEHHQWALKLWTRMDRDHSGSISSDELNCDEFQDVLRSILAPHSAAAGSSPTYARSQQNIRQAIDFCVRKADYNNDGSLSFEEFKSLLRVLRNENLASHRANLIFALFDLDGDQSLDQEEFREIYRYYLGHHPPAHEFDAEWSILNADGTGSITHEQYIRWLQRSSNAVFKQHAPPVEKEESADLPREVHLARQVADESRRKKTLRCPAPGLLPQLRSRSASAWRPSWNEKFNAKDMSNLNAVVPRRMKTYFSSPKSVTELARFYSRHQGFEQHRLRLARPEPLRRQEVLSTDSMPQILPERHVSGGTMYNSCGEKAAWIDEWQTPRSLGRSKSQPGSLLLRCPGEPPEWLYLGRDAVH